MSLKYGYHMQTHDIIDSDEYTANILTVISRAFGSVICATVIWLHKSQPKVAIDLKLCSSVLLNIIFTVVACNNHYQITLPQVTQPMTVNRQYIFEVYS